MPETTIVEATRSYEAWLARQTPVWKDDLALKHRHMADDPFLFLRATFYRWLQLWPEMCPSLQDAPTVTAIGDIHIENFGTWRDTEGRLVWGVNDLDEVCRLPYVHDLVRLAASATLALRLRHLRLAPKSVCGEILRGYRDAVAAGGRPIVLAERHRWLQDIAVRELRDPAKFWRALRDLPEAGRKGPYALLRRMLPQPIDRFRMLRRTAGAGSLGKPRFVGLARYGGSAVAREAKALVPSAAAWLSGGRGSTVRAFDAVCGAVRDRDPFLTIEGAWIVRRLAPDCIKITVGRFPGRRNHRRLLRAMGWETANVHLRDHDRAALAADLARRPRRWLEEAVEHMTGAALADWRAWKKHAPAAADGTRR